jgi:quercetin dioxygenase-like cupin family protein
MTDFYLRLRLAMKPALLAFSLFSLVGVGSYIKAQNPAGSTDQQKITVTTPAEQSVSEGSPKNFTGKVKIQSLFSALPPGRSTGGMVTFQPGARSAWHTHPLGQVLIVTDGEGWIQEWGGPRRVIRKGDVVQIPAGVKHWHGATATSSMTHIALQEISDGKNVVWMEPVTDSQYNQPK